LGPFFGDTVARVMGARRHDTDIAEVGDYLVGLLRRTAVSPAFRSLLTGLLSRSGRVLAPERRATWPAFVFGFADVLGGDRGAATKAAAAIECVIAAADTVDDLVDDDWGAFGIAPGRALNAAAALTWLAQKCVGELSATLGAVRAGAIGELLADGYLAAASGEDDDLRLEAVPNPSEEEAHAMTRCKAGSLVAMACRVGAATATDDPALLTVVGEFGAHVGTVAQLLNDLAGIDPGQNRSTDLRRRKKTLPVAFALRCAHDEDIVALREWYARPPQPCGDSGSSDREEQAIAELIRDLGGVQYTWLVASAHRREALAALDRLARDFKQTRFRSLRRLVPTVRLQRVSGSG
jgi:geranylgeranyl diphosphate synthase type I